MRRFAAIGITGVLIVMGSAACSGDDKPKEKQTAAPVAALSPVTLPDQPAALVDVISRQVKAARTLHAEIVVSATAGDRQQQEKVTAQVRTDTPSPSAQMTIIESDKAEPTTTEAVVTDGVIYTRVEGEEQAPGKPWIRLSRQDLSSPELGPFAKVFTTIYNQTEQSLREVSADTGLALVRNGAFTGTPTTEPLDGAQVRRYTGRTKTATMATDPTFDQMAKNGLAELSWRLWVDDKGLPRKYEVTMLTPQSTKVLHTASYTQWGGPVLIKAPPAAQVATLND
ncbi:hypothetical protein [Actinomadura sp. HBU206391]|uniref:hypothetical protein n=1 Tax=Actinomadura sp. HBU206391 TaxID=2731692 RepID=UPI00164FBBE7|nr:hypothetical protein [Actinomadura sp. HBU206391]MBC6456729.1 hypothetical protein [Actinomadura sp. HBU206391]